MFKLHPHFHFSSCSSPVDEHVDASNYLNFRANSTVRQVFSLIFLKKVRGKKKNISVNLNKGMTNNTGNGSNELVMHGSKSFPKI